jgi:phosphoglucosamine mutase
VTETVKAIEKELGSNGRILLRYSGTELKIRLLVETRDAALLQPVAERVLAPIRKHLGV